MAKVVRDLLAEMGIQRIHEGIMPELESERAFSHSNSKRSAKNAEGRGLISTAFCIIKTSGIGEIRTLISRQKLVPFQEIIKNQSDGLIPEYAIDAYPA